MNRERYIEIMNGIMEMQCEINEQSIKIMSEDKYTSDILIKISLQLYDVNKSLKQILSTGIC